MTVLVYNTLRDLTILEEFQDRLTDNVAANSGNRKVKAIAGNESQRAERLQIAWYCQ